MKCSHCLWRIACILCGLCLPAESQMPELSRCDPITFPIRDLFLNTLPFQLNRTSRSQDWESARMIAKVYADFLYVITGELEFYEVAVPLRMELKKINDTFEDRNCSVVAQMSVPTSLQWCVRQSGPCAQRTLQTYRCLYRQAFKTQSDIRRRVNDCETVEIFASLFRSAEGEPLNTALKLLEKLDCRRTLENNKLKMWE
ncbi:uncharacterized protein LOC144110113 isoform X2 [Amblyomma americanum]